MSNDPRYYLVKIKSKRMKPTPTRDWANSLAKAADKATIAVTWTHFHTLENSNTKYKQKVKKKKPVKCRNLSFWIDLGRILANDSLWLNPRNKSAIHTRQSNKMNNFRMRLWIKDVHVWQCITCYQLLWIQLACIEQIQVIKVFI